MRRNLTNPFDSRIPHWGMRIKTTGYGLFNQYLLALFKPLNLALFDPDCLINLSRLNIKKLINSRLLFKRRT